MKHTFIVLLRRGLLIPFIYWATHCALGFYFLGFCIVLAGLSGLVYFLKSKNSSALFIKMSFLFFVAGVVYCSLGPSGLAFSVSCIAVVFILVLAGQFVLDLVYHSFGADSVKI